MKSKILIIAVIIAASVLLMFLVRWAMYPAFSMAAILGNEPGIAEKSAVSFYGPIILEKTVLREAGRDQEGAFQTWKMVESVYRFVLLTTLLWIVVCFFAILHFWKRRGPNHTSDGIRQPADGSPKPSM